MSCTCGQSSSYVNRSVNICDPCATDTGCALQLDFSCIIYHKSNNAISNLTCLELTNGATLNQFAEAVDSYICQIKVAQYNLPCLTTTLDYTITNLKQFAEAVDTEICLIEADITTINGILAAGITKIDSNSINLSGTGFSLQADVILDPAANNRLTVSGAGALVSPQILVPNYVDKTLMISGANNVVQMASFFGTTPGYLGSFTGSDPTGLIAGQSWHRTDGSLMKFRINGTTTVQWAVV